jgi:hypothetical protein
VKEIRNPKFEILSPKTKARRFGGRSLLLLLPLLLLGVAVRADDPAEIDVGGAKFVRVVREGGERILMTDEAIERTAFELFNLTGDGWAKFAERSDQIRVAGMASGGVMKVFEAALVGKPDNEIFLTGLQSTGEVIADVLMEKLVAYENQELQTEAGVIYSKVRERMVNIRLGSGGPYRLMPQTQFTATRFTAGGGTPFRTMRIMPGLGQVASAAGFWIGVADVAGQLAGSAMHNQAQTNTIRLYCLARKRMDHNAAREYVMQGYSERDPGGGDGGILIISQHVAIQAEKLEMTGGNIAFTDKISDADAAQSFFLKCERIYLEQERIDRNEAAQVNQLIANGRAAYATWAEARMNQCLNYAYRDLLALEYLVVFAPEEAQRIHKELARALFVAPRFPGARPENYAAYYENAKTRNEELKAKFDELVEKREENNEEIEAVTELLGLDSPRAGRGDEEDPGFAGDVAPYRGFEKLWPAHEHVRSGLIARYYKAYLRKIWLETLAKDNELANANVDPSDVYLNNLRQFKHMAVEILRDAHDMAGHYAETARKFRIRGRQVGWTPDVLGNAWATHCENHPLFDSLNPWWSSCEQNLLDDRPTPCRGERKVYGYIVVLAPGVTFWTDFDKSHDPYDYRTRNEAVAGSLIPELNNTPLEDVRRRVERARQRGQNLTGSLEIEIDEVRRDLVSREAAITMIFTPVVAEFQRYLAEFKKRYGEYQRVNDDAARSLRAWTRLKRQLVHAPFSRYFKTGSEVRDITELLWQEIIADGVITSEEERRYISLYVRSILFSGPRRGVRLGQKTSSWAQDETEFQSGWLTQEAKERIAGFRREHSIGADRSDAQVAIQMQMAESARHSQQDRRNVQDAMRRSLAEEDAELRVNRARQAQRAVDQWLDAVDAVDIPASTEIESKRGEAATLMDQQLTLGARPPEDQFREFNPDEITRLVFADELAGGGASGPPYNFNFGAGVNATQVQETVKEIREAQNDLNVIEYEGGWVEDLADVVRNVVKPAIDALAEEFTAAMGNRSVVLNKYREWLQNDYPKLLEIGRRSREATRLKTSADAIGALFRERGLAWDAPPYSTLMLYERSFHEAGFIDDPAFRSRLGELYKEYRAAADERRSAVDGWSTELKGIRDRYEAVLENNILYKPNGPELAEIIKGLGLTGFNLSLRYTYDQFTADVDAKFADVLFTANDLKALDYLLGIAVKEEDLVRPEDVEIDLGKLVEEALQALERAYENGSVRDFMRRIDPAFQSHATNARDYVQLEESIREDFRNLQDIRLSLLLRGRPAIFSGGRRIEVNVNWNRKAYIRRSGQEWDLRNKNSQFIFSRGASGDVKLLSMEGGDALFGLSDYTGRIEITEGTLGGQPVTTTVAIEDGSVATADTDGGGGGWSPSPTVTQGQENNVQITDAGVASWWTYSFLGAGSFTNTGIPTREASFNLRSPGDGSLRLAGYKDAPAGIQDLGVGAIDDFTTVPTAGYNAGEIWASSGNVYAIKTVAGKYAKVRIINWVIGVGNIFVDFEWKYQPDGTPNF